MNQGLAEHVDWVAMSASTPEKLWPVCLAMVETIYEQVDCVDVQMVLEPRRLIQLLSTRPNCAHLAVVVFWLLVSAYEGCRQMIKETMTPVRWSPSATDQALEHCDYWVQVLIRRAFTRHNLLGLAEEYHRVLCMDVNTQCFQLKPTPLDGEAMPSKRKAEQRQAEQVSVNKDLSEFNDQTEQSLQQQASVLEEEGDGQSQFYVGCFVDIAQMFHQAVRKPKAISA